MPIQNCLFDECTFALKTVIYKQNINFLVGWSSTDLSSFVMNSPYLMFRGTIYRECVIGTHFHEYITVIGESRKTY